jgi:hypothetical protein
MPNGFAAALTAGLITACISNGVAGVVGILAHATIIPMRIDPGVSRCGVPIGGIREHEMWAERMPFWLFVTLVLGMLIASQYVWYIHPEWRM